MANIQIAPSHLIINNAQWDIEPSFIAYSDEGIDIQRFSIRHDDQFLAINGTASDNPLDSLVVNMKDIDVAYVLDLVGFDDN